jgi:hypothetical protein
VDRSSLFYDTWIDWLVAGLLALEGLVVAWFGVTVAGDVDRAFAEEVAAEFLSGPDAASFPLTEPEFADAVYAVATWAGWGLAVAGVLTVAAGIWFRRYRVDVRDQLAAGRPAPRWHAPLLGGLLGTALVFVPLVQVLAGVVAGALSDRSATLDGALSGVVFGAPAYAVWAAVVVGVLVAGLPSVALALVFLFLIYFVVDVVLGAVGGLVGGLLS